MNRETVAMLLCLAFVPMLILTLSGAAVWTLPAWCAGWLVLTVLTRGKSNEF